ncbi:MAG: hypothetical protein ACQES9_08460 [Myxococcota bacterium]
MILFKHIKKLALGTITVGSTILMAACYGVTDESFLVADGEVKSGNQGIQGLEVCINLNESDQQVCEITQNDGSFMINSWEDFRNKANSNGFNICVNDIDGVENGQYATKCTQIPSNRVPAYVSIDVEEDSTEL